MARAKAEKKDGKGSAAPAGLLSKIPGLTHHLGVAAGYALRPLLPLMLIGAGYGVVAVMLWRPVNNDERAVLTSEKLMQPFGSMRRPGWMTDAQLREMARIGVVQAEGHSIFEAGLAGELAKKYSECPFVERMNGVKLRYPATLVVEEPVWRVPFARLEAANTPVVLDHKGAVLPLHPVYLNPSRSGMRSPVQDLPVLAGVRGLRSTDGRSVSDPETQEGLELLSTINAILAKAPGARMAAKVQREPAGTWRVVLSQGTVVEWGFWNDDQRPQDEPSRNEKKEWLARRLVECPPQRLKFLKLDVPNFPVVLGDPVAMDTPRY